MKILSKTASFAVDLAMLVVRGAVGALADRMTAPSRIDTLEVQILDLVDELDVLKAGIKHNQVRAEFNLAPVCHNRPHGEYDPPCPICDGPLTRVMTVAASSCNALPDHVCTSCPTAHIVERPAIARVDEPARCLRCRVNEISDLGNLCDECKVGR